MRSDSEQEYTALEDCNPNLWLTCRLKDKYSRTVFTKGAAEIMLPLCSRSMTEDGSLSTLTDKARGQILDQLQKGGER